MTDMDNGTMDGPYGGSYDPCILGYTNGTYPNGTLGLGHWLNGHYSPTMSEMMACQAGNDPWEGSAKYGIWTQYFLLASFVLFFAVGLVQKVNNVTRMTAGLTVVGFGRRPAAFFRLITYPRIHPELPTAGPLLLMVAFFVYTTAFCFGVGPYYRPPNYGSSPLGLRSEWIATSVVVWIFASCARPNALAHLANVSHHALFSIHKFGGWLCLYFSTVHTVAMMVRALRQAPWSYTWSNNPAYGWSAWTALATLVWLCGMSFAPVRKVSYEAFYALHSVAAILFIVGMYCHLDAELGSWGYMHAAVVVFGIAILGRLANVLYLSRLMTSIPRADLELVTPDTLKATVFVPRLQWKAGQHVFVRFLAVRPWETHPFTIASSPPTRASDPRPLEFFIKGHAGITGRLLSLASAATLRSTSSPVLVDGPYGDVDSIAASDHILLIAGGVGFTYIGPLLSSLARELAVGGRVRSVRLVWSAKTVDGLEWGKPLIEAALADAGATTVTASYHVTGEDVGDEAKMTVVAKAAKAEDKSDDDFDIPLNRGRPDVPAIVAEAVQTSDGRLGVVGCGPKGMLFDIRKSVVKAQAAILSGRAGASEVVLHEETFSY